VFTSKVLQALQQQRNWKGYSQMGHPTKWGANLFALRRGTKSVRMAKLFSSKLTIQVINEMW